MSRSDNLENLNSLNHYMQTVGTVNDRAVHLKDLWTTWFDGLSWYDKTVDINDTWDIARNKRNDFNLANVSSSSEKRNVERVIHTGITTEEQHGDEKRILSTGKFPEPEKPLIPDKYKVIAAGAAGVTVAAIVAKKLHLI